MRAGALGLVISSALVLVSCIDPPAYRCTEQASCVLDNVQGFCDLSTQTCVYMEPGCPTGYRDGHGDCVAGPSDPTTTSDDSAATSGDAESTTEEGEGEAGDPSGMADTGVDPCAGETNDITAMGAVGASTVFESYAAGLAVDGSLSTSWFSTGPEGPMEPTRYTWTAPEERCIRGITIIGNAMHSNPKFREGFGFGLVTVKVFDLDNAVVFEEAHQLPGTPDPEATSMLMDVIGSRVVLEFYGHENDDCGGFSELSVLGD